MRDRDVRVALRGHLADLYGSDPGSLIVEELGIRQGAARADVTLVNGYLHGYEIKSPRDSLDRLTTQVKLYSEVFHRCTLVVHAHHEDAARDFLPDSWGIVVVSGSGSDPDLSVINEAEANPKFEARALVELLWKDEALAALEERGLDKGLRSKPRAILWDALADQLPGDEIGELVCRILKKRKGWKSGPRQRLGDD